MDNQAVPSGRQPPPRTRRPGHGAMPLSPPSAPRRRLNGGGGALVWFLYIAWANMLFDFHRLLGLGRLDTILSMGVLAIAVVNGITFLNRKWRMFPVALLFIALGVVALPYAVNQGTIRIFIKIFFQYWVLGVATFVTIRQARQIVPILFLVTLQYVWFFANAMPNGQVFWHSYLGDTNALASIMVMGAAWCYYFARAAKRTAIRRAAMVAAGLCLIGMVPAMARGATLALVFLIGLVFWRSPNKVRTASGLAFGGIVFLIAVNTMLPAGTFAAEFSSIFEEGTTQGTGEDRWIVWGAALEVWRAYPLTGVGLGNFGITAAGHFGPGELGGMYATNPNRLAGMAIHNDYIQILSEMGLLGLLTYMTMLYGFFKNGRRLRTKVFEAMWVRETGGAIELRMLSLAFEAAMIALLINGIFYPQLDKPWFWALMILQFSIYHNLRDAIRRSTVTQRSAGGRPRTPVHPLPGWQPTGRPVAGPSGVPA